MADLDDFFAKKDRKKANKGKKFTTTDEIAKKLEETGKKADKPKPKDKPLNPDGTPAADDNQHHEDEDEWKDFEEEKKDYTGLKIGNLTVTEGVSTDGDNERGTAENSSDQESGEGGSGQKGPWKNKDAPPEPEPVQAPPPQPTQPAPPAQTTSSYKPPMLRGAHPASMSSMDRPMGRLRNKNIAPDISSEEYFPTLNSKPPSNETTNVWGRKKRDEGSFEEVRNRGGSRLYNTPDIQSQAPKLSLGNKYGALPQDQS